MKKRILIVEDEAEFRMAVRLRLESQGYEVTEAENGRLGLDLAAKLKPDLVILDVNMPVVNGFEVARLLSSDPACREIPIIMLTVRSQVQDKKEGAESGADVYLIKPFIAGDLLKAIVELIGS